VAHIEPRRNRFVRDRRGGSAERLALATEGCNTRGDLGMSIEVSLHLAAPGGVQQVIDEAVQVVFGNWVRGHH